VSIGRQSQLHQKVTSHFRFVPVFGELRWFLRVFFSPFVDDVFWIVAICSLAFRLVRVCLPFFFGGSSSKATPTFIWWESTTGGSTSQGHKPSVSIGRQSQLHQKVTSHFRFVPVFGELRLFLRVLLITTSCSLMTIGTGTGVEAGILPRAIRE
jgi:hypothetical protein